MFNAVQETRTTNMVLGPGAKVVVFAVWAVLTGVPSLLLAGFDVRLRSSSGVDAAVVILPMLWLTCVALTSAFCWKILGQVEEVEPEAEPEQELAHLPRECAMMVHEARSIRVDPGTTKELLERAWRLAQDLEVASPSVQEFVHGCGASLAPVHQLLGESTREDRRAPSHEQLRESLHAALSAFEDALREPRSRRYR